MSDNSLENQVRELMEGLEFKPDAAVWNNLKAELNPVKKRSFFSWRSAVWVLLLCGAGAGLFAWLGTSSEQEEPAAQAAGTTVAPAAGTVLSPATRGADTAVTALNTPADSATTIVNPLNGIAVIEKKSSVDQLPAGHTTTLANLHKHNNKLLAITAPAQQQTPTLQSGSNSEGNNQAVVAATDLATGGLYQPWAASVLNNDYTIVVQEAAGVSAGKTPVAAPGCNFQPAVAAPVITRSPTVSRKWQVLPFVNAGIVSHVGNTYTQTSSEKFAASMAVQPGNNLGANPQASTIEYTKTQTKAGKAFSIGALAEKPLSQKWSLQLGLRYQYIAYDINNFLMRDSFSRMNNGAFATLPGSSSVSTDQYRLHSAGIPVLMRYHLSKPLDIAAGLMNDFSVASKKNGASLSGEDLRFWTPSAYFAFVVKVPGAGKQQWMIMPYIQYGLLSSTRITGSQRTLQSGVSLTLGLNK